uniref:Non-structural protein 5 n=1 Tax=Rotavirus A TaxID=28875 RepID=A0A8D5ZHU6_9REOV|nr:non-structural protein 5 [Rotavirus A]
MSLTVDVTSLPSITSSFFNNESSNNSSTLSGKSIGRSEQYVSSDAKAFTTYMLSKSPEDIEPFDSASNDPLTSFSIRTNAVKTNSNGGVSMDASTDSRSGENSIYDSVDFSFAKGLNINAGLDSKINITTSSQIDDDSSRTKNKKGKKKRSDQMNKQIISAFSDSENYVLSDSDSDEGQCNNCKYKKKYFILRERMKNIALQLITDL